jgi:hypothetical protein
MTAVGETAPLLRALTEWPHQIDYAAAGGLRNGAVGAMLSAMDQRKTGWLCAFVAVAFAAMWLLMNMEIESGSEIWLILSLVFAARAVTIFLSRKKHRNG